MTDVMFLFTLMDSKTEKKTPMYFDRFSFDADAKKIVDDVLEPCECFNS